MLESRQTGDRGAIRRRRECAGCADRFTTYERREPAPLFVRKRDGDVQRFDRTKLRAALLRAAHKRPVSAGDVEDLVGRIELAIETSGGELTAARIGELCLSGLRELDPGAYLQFAGTLSGDRSAIEAAISGLSGAAEPRGSVRGERKDVGSTPQAASRRGNDG